MTESKLWKLCSEFEQAVAEYAAAFEQRRWEAMQELAPRIEQMHLTLDDKIRLGIMPNLRAEAELIRKELERRGALEHTISSAGIDGGGEVAPASEAVDPEDGLSLIKRYSSASIKLAKIIKSVLDELELRGPQNTPVQYLQAYVRSPAKLREMNSYLRAYR